MQKFRSTKELLPGRSGHRNPDKLPLAFLSPERLSSPQNTGQNVQFDQHCGPCNRHSFASGWTHWFQTNLNHNHNQPSKVCRLPQQSLVLQTTTEHIERWKKTWAWDRFFLSRLSISIYFWGGVPRSYSSSLLTSGLLKIIYLHWLCTFFLGGPYVGPLAFKFIHRFWLKTRQSLEIIRYWPRTPVQRGIV